VPWPGGESWRQAVTRVTEFYEELRMRHDGERVLVVGHVATRWALDHLQGIPLEELVAAEFEWQPGWEYVL
jgi:broad specificity phosphatase PhoE